MMASLKVGRHVNAFLWKIYLGKLELYVQLFYHYHGCVVASFPGFPVHHPVFDRLQYAKTEGGGLVCFIM